MVFKQLLNIPRNLMNEIKMHAATMLLSDGVTLSVYEDYVGLEPNAQFQRTMLILTMCLAKK